MYYTLQWISLNSMSRNNDGGADIIFQISNELKFAGQSQVTATVTPFSGMAVLKLFFDIHL